jgi:cAMP phosphodiesterase
MQGFHAPSFLFGERILFDAGSLCTLPFEDILKIDHIFISHTHVDHIKDLGLFADLLTGQRTEPVVVYGTQTVIDGLRNHYFNNIIWPDFSRIPTPETAVLQLRVIEPMKPVVFGEYEVLPVPVNHTIETTGFVLKWPEGSFVYIADTGPTELIWDVANSLTDLTGLIVEVAFPDHLEWLAKVSGHLTPGMVQHELGKFAHADVPVYFFHLKPVFYDELVQELTPQLGDTRKILKSGSKIAL